MPWRRGLVAVAGMLVAGVLVGWSLHTSRPDMERDRWAVWAGWNPEHLTAPERLLAADDGKYTVALAEDPLLRRPEVFREGRSEAVYRASRPMLGWLLDAVTFGHPSPGALLLLAVGCAGLAVFAVGLLLESVGRSAWWAVLVPLLPGVPLTLKGGYADLLALAAVVATVLAWRERSGWAVVFAVVAALTRETTLVVPLVLAGYDYVRTRDRERLGLFAVPVLVYSGWLAVVAVRFGALPGGGMPGRLALPGVGIVRSAGSWSVGGVAVTVGLVVLVGVGVWRASEADRWLLVGLAAAASMFGPAVWGNADQGWRLVLPLTVFGLCGLPKPVARRDDHVGRAESGTDEPADTDVGRRHVRSGIVG